MDIQKVAGTLMATGKTGFFGCTLLGGDGSNNDKLARMDYLVNRILADFDIESMIQFSGIISYEADESNPLADILTRIQTNNRLGKYPDYGGYTLVEPHDEQVKWVIPLNEPSPRRVE